MTPDFCFDGLSLEIGKRRVLNNISGGFNKGRVTAIMGANGAGKSSLLACLAGLHASQAGKVTLDGQPLNVIPASWRARRIALLPQQAAIHWDVTVRAVVALGRLPYQGRGGLDDDDQAAIEQALQDTNCTHLADRTALRLSGGEQRRVLLARVLAGGPDWLLADEPLAGLDLAHQYDTLALLRRCAAQGAGVVVVLHDLAHAAEIADDILLLKSGHIVAAGAAVDVLTPDHVSEVFGVRQSQIAHMFQGATSRS